MTDLVWPKGRKQNKPKEPGWYFWRKAKGRPAEVCEVDGDKVEWGDGWESSVAQMRGQFSGPIQLPREAE